MIEELANEEKNYLGQMLQDRLSYTMYQLDNADDNELARHWLIIGSIAEKHEINLEEYYLHCGLCDKKMRPYESIEWNSRKTVPTPTESMTICKECDIISNEKSQKWWELCLDF